MKHVLVTGGNGFIGGYVTEELVARGYRPVILDTRWRQPVAAEAELVLGDIRDATSVTEAIAHVDGVIHLAGVLGTQETITNPRPAAEINIIGGLNVFEAVAQYNLPAVNIAVGNWWMNNTYSITKNTMERFAEMFNRFRGTALTVVRALNAYGPRQSAAEPFGPSKVRKVMPSFVCRALSGMPIEVYGDGEQVMDFIHVRDVARILVTALEFTADFGAVPTTLEAGSGRRTTINEVVGILSAEMSRRGHTAAIQHLPMRPGEDANSVVLGDPSTLEQIGISPDSLIRMEDAITETVDYFEKLIAPSLALVG